MEKIKFNKGESISIGFLLNSEYDMNRIESCSAWVGGKKFQLATIGQMLRCEIKSTETHLLAGKYKLILWLDDSVLGIKKIEVADVEISFNHANDNNSSINEGYDFVFNITINETAIEAGDVLYNYVKGNNADLPDGIVIDSEYWDDKKRLENTSGTNTGDQDLSWLATKLEIESKADLVNGLIPSSQLPSYVDDVIEVANFAALPITGESGKIYITQDDNLTYRWSGTGYAEISKSLALGETSSTAYRGDRGKIAYDHSQIVAGNPHGTTASEVGASPLGHNHSGEGINPDYIVLDEEYTDLTMVALPVGSLFYNVDQLSWLLKTSTTTYLNLGEENTYIAKNGDGVTHLEGQVAYVTSGGGNLDVMTLASSANGKIDALATQDVLYTGNRRGMYCFGGKVRTFPYANVIKSTDNKNTWVEGADLYLCDEPGRYSTTIEDAPAKCSVVGKITQRNGANISVSFRPFKAIAFEDLSNVDGNATTLADTDEHLFKDVVTGLWKKITHSNLVVKLQSIFYSKTIADRKFVDQNGGTIYHITRWFTPTSALTIASNGLSATITSGQFTSTMTGAKLRLTGGVNEPIITYVSSNQINLSFAVDSSFFGQSVAIADWGVYLKRENRDSNGTLISFQSYNNETSVLNVRAIYDNFFGKWFLDGNITNSLQMARDFSLKWTTGTYTSGWADTKDTGLFRPSEGLLQIYNGITTSALRDLKLRSLYADKIIPNSDTTGVVIRNAADTEGVVKVDTANKRIGIGTAAPQLPATIFDSVSTSGQIRLGFNDSFCWDIGRDRLVNGRFMFINVHSGVSNEFFSILINGNFGINNTNPETRLDVNGTTTHRDWVYLNNGTHTGDVVGDIRMKNESGVLTFYRCTVGHATKGSGTWVSIHTIG